LIRGNPSKRAMPKREPQPTADLHRAPDHLSDAQRKLWTRLIAALPAGLLKRADEGLVSGYCMAWASVIEADQALQNSSLVVTIGTGKHRILVVNPFEKVRRLNLALMVRIASEIGLSPVSRTRIELSPDDTGPDEWSAILEDR
jgi:P27 family predicted phage terminase small subunit